MLLASLYGIVDRLETLFSSRKFTPDGHLVGSIGEVIAAHMFGLTLLPASYPDHDAFSILLRTGTRAERSTPTTRLTMVCLGYRTLHRTPDPPPKL